MESIEEIIRLREEAIRKLLEEKERLEGELKTLTVRLKEIDGQLERLGYATRLRSSSLATGQRRGKMEDSVYEGRYKGETYTLRIESSVGTVDGLDGEFHSLTAAARAVKETVTGRKMAESGPRFWKRTT